MARIRHVAFYVKDPERTAEFYRDESIIDELEKEGFFKSLKSK